jgi:cytochrome c oxidase assembly protein subunit 15
MPGWLIRRLGVVILLAMAAATFGWIMVASGLNNDDRTWVSAYKLVIHLGIATSLFGYLFWTWLRASQTRSGGVEFPKLKRQIWVIAFVLFVQIIFGGLMAGMRAGLIHPHFPAFVEGEKLWSALTATAELNAEGIIDYEPNRFAKAAVQVLHRGMAYVLAILIFVFYRRANQQMVPKRMKLGVQMMLGMLVIQFLLGISTVINSVGKIPVSWGAVHQAGALVLLLSVLFVAYLLGSGGTRGELRSN